MTTIQFNRKLERFMFGFAFLAYYVHTLCVFDISKLNTPIRYRAMLYPADTVMFVFFGILLGGVFYLLDEHLASENRK